MDILKALDNLCEGESPLKVAEELGIEVDGVDMRDPQLLEFAAADELEAGRKKWGQRGPMGGGAAEQARQLLQAVADIAPRFARTAQLDKALGGRRATVQRVKNMLLGSGHLGEVTPKGKKRRTYVLTPKGLEFLRMQGLIQADKYNRIKGSTGYMRAAQVGAKLGAQHKVKPSPKQKKQASLQKALGSIASTSPLGLRSGTSVGSFGFHKKGNNYSITVSARKVGAKNYKLPTLFYGTKSMPPTRYVAHVQKNMIQNELAKAGIQVAGDLKIIGYQADLSKPDDIIIGFQGREQQQPSQPQGAQQGVSQ